MTYKVICVQTKNEQTEAVEQAINNFVSEGYQFVSMNSIHVFSDNDLGVSTSVSMNDYFNHYIVFGYQKTELEE